MGFNPTGDIPSKCIMSVSGLYPGWDSEGVCRSLSGLTDSHPRAFLLKMVTPPLAVGTSGGLRPGQEEGGPPERLPFLPQLISWPMGVTVLRKQPRIEP